MGSDKKSGDKKSKKAEDKKSKKADSDDKVTPRATPQAGRATARATTMVATAIAPNLFIGTREDAEALGEHVPDDWACISVTEYRSRYKRTEELPREPVGSLDMPFMADWPDGWHADPYKLDLIAETIWWKIHAWGKKVLVHCIHAQERAPLAAAWYLAWSGTAPSVAAAYEIVARLHPRTEARPKWIRDASPGKRRPELSALLDAARALKGADPDVRPIALAQLEAAAIAWSISPPSPE